MGKEILILGAGFGGLEAAAGLREQLDDTHNITLIDRSDHFIIGFTKFDVMFGKRTAGQVKSYYANLAYDVNFLQDTITRIDPEQRLVETTGRRFAYDHLIVALGAALAPEATPGFIEGGHEFYSLPGAAELYPVLDNFQGGTILLSVLGMPYKCPPAPFEAAFQLHDFYRRKGLREQVALKMLIPTAVPLPVAPGAPEQIRRRFAERGIELLTEHQVTSLDPGRQEAQIAGREPLPYDLFIGIPIHRPPQVVRESPLGQGGWIKVNRDTLETAYENVYAVGDVTAIPVREQAVPKAGAFAASGARVVVSRIVHQLTGAGQPLKYEATGACFLEFGDDQVAQISANFLGQEEPVVSLDEPSPELRENKQRFESEHLRRWFR